MSTKTKIDVKEKYGLRNSYELVYVDYRDCIEDHKLIEQCVQAGDTSPLWEDSIDSWMSDQQWESVNQIIEELEKEHGEIPDDEKEMIRDYLYEHDDSTPLEDLLRNSSSQYFYYSLGLEDNGMTLEGGEPDEDRLKAILDRLQTKDEKVIKAARSVINNAGYGGNWVILFEDDIKDMLDDGKVIEFGAKAELCLMNRGNGSGHSEETGVKIVCEFDRRNLHCDRGAGGYSFTHDVCGMSRGFMDGATIRDLKSDDKPLPALRNEREEKRLERETLLEKKWRDTKTCTFGDMNYNRHEKQVYINDFPCGNRCTKCGTFWID